MNQVAALTIDGTQAESISKVPVPIAMDEESGNYLSAILRAARDPRTDVEKVRGLMQLRKEMMAEEAERSFNTAMRDVQNKMPRVWRNKKGDGTTRYADLEAVDIGSRPIITEHGFAESYGTTESPLKDHYRITCLVSHVDGHSRPYQADVPTDMLGPKGAAVKTAIHGFGSSMSYGRRYLKCLIWNIVLTNEDDDGKAASGNTAPAFISDDQVATLRKEMNDREIKEAAFCAFAGYPLEEMPTADYETALKNIHRKPKKVA